ncbi:MAG: hypothetical protein DI563_07690 [Variovorax paradoxus]|uniref:Plasmid stabilization protein n=1 Tax=Variovorax paradoxus TaxID=34073 RepID=A0A2W5S982_VARPD|nr:MAG: hypothetical protein DI563_07690 [Variovorax paradoxus]
MSEGVFMKVAVLNYSGNVGKSTLARHLLQPRMGDCPIVYIESINETGDDSSNVKGKDFTKVMVEVLAAERAIVDIGSSNIEQVFSKVGQMGDILNDFDFFLVPTVAKAKQQQDTVKVLRDLITLGVPPTKLKVVFNHVDPEDDVDRVFANVKSATDQLQIASAVIHESEGFAFLQNGRTVKDCVAAGRNFREEIAAAASKDEKRELASAQIVSRLSKGIQDEMDTAFKALFGKS